MQFLSQTSVLCIIFASVKSIPDRHKIHDIFLEDDTLTLWRPSHNAKQYNLISETALQNGGSCQGLQSYYTKFDCVTSTLRFDDLVPIFSKQSTTLRPTDDYSILRDYQSIQGLWFKPDQEERLGPEEETSLGNAKLVIDLARQEKESIFMKMNMYFLEVLDYPSEDKSVSRLLLTQTRHKEFEKYDLHKPGGPVHIVKESDGVDGEVGMYYLRTCNNYRGRIWRHEVEFMLEEDPWPMCKLIPLNNYCFRRPTITPVRDVSARLPCRYVGASWRETLAGLFVWSLRTYLVWLVWERLHEKVKHALDLATNHVNITDVVHTECPLVCQEMFDTYDTLATFIAKCENEQDIRDLFNVFLSLHTCGQDCTMVTLKSLTSTKVLPGILYFLEKIIACANPPLRQEITSTIMPWSIMGYYCSDMKIKSHRKMVIFISQLPGVNSDLDQFLGSAFLDGRPDPISPSANTGFYYAGSVIRKRGLSRSSQFSSVSSIDST